MSRRRSQRGVVLLMTLIMLVVITLFVMSMVRLGNTNAAIVGNMQAQKSVDAEAQQALEVALNHFSFFEDAAQEKNSWASPSTDSLSYAALWTGYAPAGATTAPATRANDIKVYRPQCLFFEPATGYSALSGVAPQDTYWDVEATAGDATTGASTELHQGVQIRLPAGNCK
jgi:hypothetical protein